MQLISKRLGLLLIFGSCSIFFALQFMATRLDVTALWMLFVAFTQGHLILAIVTALVYRSRLVPFRTHSWHVSHWWDLLVVFGAPWIGPLVYASRARKGREPDG